MLYTLFIFEVNCNDCKVKTFQLYGTYFFFVQYNNIGILIIFWFLSSENSIMLVESDYIFRLMVCCTGNLNNSLTMSKKLHLA